MVVRSHGHTTRDAEDLGLRKRLRQRRDGRGVVVAGVAAVDQLRTRSACQRADRHGVRIVDLARPERLPGRNQLVTRRDDGQPRALRARSVGEPERREHPQLGRAEVRARAQHAGASVEVVTGAADVRSRLGVRYLHELSARGDPLDRHDRIRAARNHGARLELALERLPRLRLPDDRQPAAWACNHGEAVHGRRVERRQLQVTDHVLGEDAPERVVDRDRLMPERTHGGEHAGARLFHRNQLAGHEPARSTRSGQCGCQSRQLVCACPRRASRGCASCAFAPSRWTARA